MIYFPNFPLETPLVGTIECPLRFVSLQFLVLYGQFNDAHSRFGLGHYESCCNKNGQNFLKNLSGPSSVLMPCYQANLVNHSPSKLEQKHTLGGGGLWPIMRRYQGVTPHPKLLRFLLAMKIDSPYFGSNEKSIFPCPPFHLSPFLNEK